MGKIRSANIFYKEKTFSTLQEIKNKHVTNFHPKCSIKFCEFRIFFCEFACKIRQPILSGILQEKECVSFNFGNTLLLKNNYASLEDLSE